MNRIEIKNEAKKLIKNNIWNLIKPYLVFWLISVLFSLILILFQVKENSWQEIVLNQLFSLFMVPLSVGIAYYYLKFIRKNEYNLSDIFSFSQYFLQIILISIVLNIIVSLGIALLIIPGIILSLAYSMTNYLIADGNKTIKDTLTKSRSMMRGYKADYLLFNLSFIGWILLGIITLGIAYIYVIPYVGIANALYYEKLKK